jgi:purine-nucleoside phosphorylase
MDRLREAVLAIRARTALIPKAALLFDSTLASVLGGRDEGVLVPIPSGHLLGLGRLDDTVVAGWDHTDPATSAHRAFPVRVARLLGAEVLVLASIEPRLTPARARIGVVTDHIAIFVPNPIVGPNPDELGPRFPDMTDAYDPRLRALAREEASRAGIELSEGICAALPDQNPARAAEYRVLREVGVDWVGTGGVQEVIAARHVGMRVVSLIGEPGALGAVAGLARAILDRLP